MGAFGSKHHHCNQDHSKNAAPGGKDRFAKFGDDYHTLEQVSQIDR